MKQWMRTLGLWTRRFRSRFLTFVLGQGQRVHGPGKGPLNLGRWGEREAYIFLSQQGYTIVARNFRTSRGEIDLVAWDRDILCFVEVKTRASQEHGRPEESVTAFKQRQIVSTSIDYLRHANLRETNTRFDIVTVQWGGAGRSRCRLIRGAFGSRTN